MEMNLYHVQDADRPLYVLAPTMAAALDRWRGKIRAESPGDYAAGESPQADGVTLVASSDDFIQDGVADVDALQAAYDWSMDEFSKADNLSLPLPSWVDQAREVLDRRRPGPVTVPTHVRGTDPDGELWEVVDLETGAFVDNVVEVDTELGFVRCYVVDERGMILLDGAEFRTKRVEGRFKLVPKRKR